MKYACFKWIIKLESEIRVSEKYDLSFYLMSKGAEKSLIPAAVIEPWLLRLKAYSNNKS